MSWTESETRSWRETNDKMLAEINATLRPDAEAQGIKIGIFCHGQVGDIATAMSVLKYRNELWPNKQIIWFANWPNADLLRYAPISEVRMWPWAGNGLPEGTPDFYPLLATPEGRLDLIKAKDYELTRDLSDGYFPAPHMRTPEQRHGLDYPNVSRSVFGVSKDKEWHPVLSWSDNEKKLFDPYVFTDLTTGKKAKVIMLETYFGSGQSQWNDLMTVKTIEMCREAWGKCIFIFCSHKNTEQFKDFEGYISLSKATPRQVALAIDKCDLFIGVSSGMSVVTSAWGLRATPKMQFCGSYTCSTVALSTGEINLITSDDKPLEQSRNEYYAKLKEVISRIK